MKKDDEFKVVIDYLVETEKALFLLRYHIKRLEAERDMLMKLWYGTTIWMDAFPGLHEMVSEMEKRNEGR